MYMSPTNPKQKENLRKIAIEKEASEDVEIYVWKMVKGGKATNIQKSQKQGSIKGTLSK